MPYNYTNPFVPPSATGPPDATAAGLRTLGVTAIMLALCGLVALPWGLAPFHAGHWSMTRGEIAGASVWMLVATLAGAGLSLLLLIGGVGCWALRRWARPVLLIYGIASMVVGVAGCVFFTRWFFSSGADAQVRGVASCFLVTAWPIGTLFGVYVVYYMTRSAVKEILDRGPRDTDDAAT